MKTIVFQKRTQILNRIKRLRLLQGFTQYQMGSFMGISQNAYYKLEKGKTKLDLDRLILLSIQFNIQLPDLVK